MAPVHGACQGLFVICFFVSCLASAPGKYGYYEVRKGAHTFWWLFPALECDPKDAPLVLWLQGGPGASGTGFGNFEEVGPYKRDWKPRESTWAKHANLLFVDNPVGTGFSFVEPNASFARNNSMIAQDLTSFLRQFLDEHAAHEKPLFIFCESYGGKMGIEFARNLLRGQEDGHLKVNLRGIALGDSWISPLDFVLTWGSFLKAWSLLDDYQLNELTPLLLDTQEAVQSGNLTLATDFWGRVEGKIGNLTDNVDWYNALLHNIPDSQASWLKQASSNGASAGLAAGLRLLSRHHEDPLTSFMRGDVTRNLGIIPKGVSWGSQSDQVFKNLAGDFMVDSIAAVDAVLETGLPVTIYNGQLDLICATVGVDAWLPKLKWDGLDKFQAAKPKPIHGLADKPRQTTGFFRQHKNLAMYIILNSGHMIPADQPQVASDMLERIVGGCQGTLAREAERLHVT